MNEPQAILALQHGQAQAHALTEGLNTLSQESARLKAPELIQDAEKLLTHLKNKLAEWPRLKHDTAPFSNPPKGAPPPTPRFKQESDKLLRGLNQVLDAMRRLSVTVLTSAASADVIGALSLDTSALMGDPNAPFSLDFQLIENTANLNQVTLSNFLFGGGSITAVPSSSTGGIIVGSTPFSVELDGSSFLNDVQFAFTPGTSFSFEIDATGVSDPIGPDTFTFAVLDKNGVELPTTNSFFDVFAEIDLPSGGAPSAVTLSGTDTTRTTISIASPDFASAVPEPNPFLPLSSVLALMAIRRLRRPSQ